MGWLKEEVGNGKKKKKTKKKGGAANQLRLFCAYLCPMYCTSTSNAALC